MSLFRRKRCKDKEVILDIKRVCDCPNVVLLRIDVFPNQSAVIELHSNKDEVFRISVSDVKRLS